MTEFKRFFILFCLSLPIAKTNGFDVSHWTYLEKASDLDTGCLHNLTLDDHVTEYTFTVAEEQEFLLELFNKTNGQNWKRKDKWGDKNIHHCKWAGIQCYPNNSYVKWIELALNDMEGTPPSFWKFRNLQGICISRNHNITGSLSDIVSANMTRLRRLSVSFTNINGTIPWDTIIQLQNLEKLQLCCMVGAGLKGHLPEDIGKLYKLQVLSLGENHLISELPPTIRNLTKLWFLDLEYVKLTKGNLSYFSNMTKLESLHMTNCKFKGELPNDFGKTHPKLSDIILLGNELHGELHEDVFIGFNNLQHLSLHGNNLRGLIPRSLGNVHSLKVLDLAANQFSGFQENMTFSDNLEILSLSGNKMNRNITDLIGRLQKCRNLRILIATECSFRGSMPSEIWKFPLLTYLDLSMNSLSGQVVSADAYNMLYLFHISLASNNFSGNINTMTFFAPLKALTYLNITDNPLLQVSLQTYLQPKYDFIHRKQNYSCPSVEITSTRGIAEMDASTYKYSLCFCTFGFYGYNHHCLPCMKGGTCEKKASSLIVIKDQLQKDSDKNEITMTINEGYWPYGNSFDDVKRLVKCSKKIGEEVCSPSGKCSCTLNMTNNDQLKTSCNKSCVCAYGNEGQFCSKCIPGYYKRGNSCVKCPDFRKNFPVVMTVCFVVCLIASVMLLTLFRKHKRLCLIMIGILVIALIILHLSSVIPGWFFIIVAAVWIVGLSTESHDLQSTICITVFYFQSLDAMLSEASIWPKSIILFKYKLTNIFNFELAQLTCSFSGVSKPEILFIIILLLPSAAIVLIWLAYVLSKLCCKFISSSICKRLTIQVLILVYFPITTKSLSALSPCASQDGLSYLADAPWLDCNGTSYKWLKILGYFSLLLFVIAVPAFVFLPLLRTGLDANGNPVSPETGLWLKPLYEEFKSPYRRWFPLIFLARRLLLAVMLSLVARTSCYQILGITIVLLAFVIIILIARPYEEYSNKFQFENMADVVVSIVLLLSFVGLAFVGNSSHIDDFLVSIIVSINFVIVLFCVGGLLTLFTINLLRKSEEYELIPDA